jgi:chemotaxis protein methyltransferase CheR
MALIEAFDCHAPPVEIIATDLDTEALSAASRAEYPDAALEAMDTARRDRFFRMSDSRGRRRLASSVRNLVAFRVLNLASQDWPLKGPFDVIFCRNVLMYLEARRRCTALENIASFLAPDGLLILDPTEHLGRAGNLFASKGSGVYAHKCTLFSPDGLHPKCSCGSSKD